MEPRIETLKEKRLAGMRATMSFANNRTRELWQRFMPRRGEIENRVGTDLYSLEIYPPGFFEPFDEEAQFEKWAAVQVTDHDILPSEMKALTVPEGLYAVFLHQGPASEGPKTYGLIFQEWLPRSAYVLDDRPHFAVMGEEYKGEDPDSEEELWIPIWPRDSQA